MRQKKPDHLEQKRPLFFTIGLCSTLMIVYVLFQIKTYPKEIVPVSDRTALNIDDGLEIPITRPKQPQPPEKLELITKEKKVVIHDLFIEVPNDWAVDDESDSLFTIADINFGGDDPVLNIDLPSLDKKPVFPGCENLLSEEERFACFQQKMIAFVQGNFKPCEQVFRSASEKIYLKFTIDENGISGEPQIIRGEDACNIEEAKDLVAKLPEMKPGMYRDKYVRTSFVLPINIK